MFDINAIAAPLAMLLGAAFVLAGGIVLPIWQLNEDENDKH